MELRSAAQRSIDLSGKRFLIIGGAGFLGSILTRRLLLEGAAVRWLDRFLYGRKTASLFREYGRFEALSGDQRKEETLLQASDGVDAVVHLGAIVGDDASALIPKVAHTTNLQATDAIARVCIRRGVSRLVFASSCSVYGACDDDIDEETALNPISLYARTKIDSESVLRRHQNGVLKPTILRLATLYGVSPRMRFDLAVNGMSIRALMEGAVTVHGGGQWRPFLHLEDAAECILRCLAAPISQVGGATLNVGDEGSNIRILDLAEMIRKQLPETEVRIEPQARDLRTYRVTFARSRALLGPYVTHRIDDGVREVVWRAREGLYQDYRERSYYNLAALRVRYAKTEAMQA